MEFILMGYNSILSTGEERPCPRGQSGLFPNCTGNEFISTHSNITQQDHFKDNMTNITIGQHYRKIDRDIYKATWLSILELARTTSKWTSE